MGGKLALSTRIRELCCTRRQQVAVLFPYLSLDTEIFLLHHVDNPFYLGRYGLPKGAGPKIRDLRAGLPP
jgi:hypothetical protein